MEPPSRISEGAELALLERSIDAALEREQGFVANLRALSTSKRVLLAAASGVAMVGGVALLLRRPDFSAYPPLRLALTAGTYGAFALALVVRGLLPLHRPERSPGGDVALYVTALLLPFALGLLPPAHLNHAVDTAGGGNDCLVLGLVLGTVLITLLRFLDRVADDDPRSAAMSAAAGGLIANLALSFHCPRVEPLHLALVHAPIGLFLLFLYKRILRRSLTSSRLRTP